MSLHGSEERRSGLRIRGALGAGLMLGSCAVLTLAWVNTGYAQGSSQTDRAPMGWFSGGRQT